MQGVQKNVYTLRLQFLYNVYTFFGDTLYDL